MNGRILGSILVLVAAVLLWWAFRPRALPVETARIEKGPIEITLDHEGKTRLKDLHVIRAPLSGQLRRIELEPGDAVRIGETELAVIEPLDPELLDSRALAMAAARIEAARAALGRADKERARADEQERLARQEHERQLRLQDRGVTPLAVLEASERDLRRAEGDLSVAAAGVEVARYELTLAEAALERSRRWSPADGDSPPDGSAAMILVSPIDGRVFRVQRESEGPVTMGEPLIEIGDPRHLEIVADYLSSDAIRIRPGMPARVEAWGGQRDLGAQVRLVEPRGYTKLSALGIEQQHVDVVLDFVAAEGEMPPLGDGYRVQVKVTIEAQSEVLLLPEGALFRGREGWEVFVVEKGRARRRAVEIGAGNGLVVQVLSGLEPGEEVILHPGNDIADDVPVRRLDSAASR